MEYASTTTLNRIRAASPCREGWTKLLSSQGKTKADDDPLDLLAVLDSNGFDDALWVLSYAMPDDRLARHFQAWCAEQVLHIFEREFPEDPRVRNQIEALKDDTLSAAARVAAWAAAWDAVRDADAGGAAARASAWASARDADAGAAAGAAAWAAARGADAGDAARDAQERQLRKMLAAS